MYYEEKLLTADEDASEFLAFAVPRVV